jgi:hypothetical protein
MLNISNIVEKSTNKSYPAEIRGWEENKLTTVHRSSVTNKLETNEFTLFHKDNGIWENDLYTVKYPKIDKTTKIETLVRVPKKQPK